MRILGIDPGLRCTGYGMLDCSNAQPRLIEAGVFRIDSQQPLSSRLANLHDDLNDTIAELRPDYVVVETLYSHYERARTAILMGHARGVILLAAGTRQIEVIDYTATEVKKAVTGHGHADKQQVQEAVMHQLGLRQRPEPYDVSDAIAIAICASRRLEPIAMPTQRPTSISEAS